MAKLTKKLELMLELDRLEKKVIFIKDQFKDFPSTKARLKKEVLDLKRALSAEQEHYEEQKLEISYIKDELIEIKSKIAGIAKSIDEKYDEELADLLVAKQNLLKLREEELKASETLLVDTIEVVNEAEEKHRSTKEADEAIITKLTLEKDTYEEEMAQLKLQQDAIFKELSDLNTNEDLVVLYERISEAFPGGVIAKIDKESCTRCFIGITPQLLNELYAEAINGDEAIITCPSCRCIIYIDPEEIV